MQPEGPKIVAVRRDYHKILGLKELTIFVQIEACRTEIWPNSRPKNWIFPQFWDFKMQIFQNLWFQVKIGCKKTKNSETGVIWRARWLWKRDSLFTAHTYGIHTWEYPPPPGLDPGALWDMYIRFILWLLHNLRFGHIVFTQKYTRNPRTCSIFISAWRSSGFLCNKRNMVLQVCMLSACIAVWTWRQTRVKRHTARKDRERICGWQKPEDPKIKPNGWQRHYMGQYDYLLTLIMIIYRLSFQLGVSSMQ